MWYTILVTIPRVSPWAERFPYSGKYGAKKGCAPDISCGGGCVRRKKFEKSKKRGTYHDYESYRDQARCR